MLSLGLGVVGPFFEECGEEFLVEPQNEGHILEPDFLGVG